MYAATAEYLSKRYWLNSIPEWIDAPERYLDQPWFVTSNRDLHELLTFYSPAEFRSRNIFTEAAPLRRARTWQAEEWLQERLASSDEQDTTFWKLRA